MSESRPEPARPTPDAAERAERRRLRRRYRADRRFRWYGILAISVAVVFLAYFLFDIVSRGYSAFEKHEVRATLEITPQTVENRRQLVEEVSPELISNAALERIQLSVQRYEFELPVLLTGREPFDPAEAIRRGVQRRAESLLGKLDEQLQQARDRGDDRMVERTTDRIEDVQEAAAAVADHAPGFVDLEALRQRMRNRVIDANQNAPVSDAARRDGAIVRSLWVRLNRPASLQLLKDASSLNEAEKRSLQQLVFFHLRRLTERGFRKVYDREAADALPRRQWLLASSVADLFLKGKSNRLTSAAGAYQRACEIIGVSPESDPDPFAILSAAFAQQRVSAARYAEHLESVGLGVTAEPSAAAVLAAASERQGRSTSAEHFASLIAEVERAERRSQDNGNADRVEDALRPLRDAVASLGLPPRHARSPFLLLAAMLERDAAAADAPPPTANELRLMAENRRRWHDAPQALVELSEDPARMREVASRFFPPSPSEAGQRYARLLGWIGREPARDPDPFAVMSGALASLDVVGYNAEALSSMAAAWSQQRELERLAEAGRTRAVFNANFFTGTNDGRPEAAGLWNAVVGSIFLLVIVLCVAFPIGVLTAIYLEEFAPDNAFTRTIEVNINNLAAVPSILFGLLGLALFVNLVGFPRSVPLVGGLTLSLMSLPVIIIATRAALSAVPDSIRKGAQAMGATRWQTVLHHVLPLAMPGILTGTIIALAQAIGETAPLIIIGMVGFITTVPSDPLEPATALPAQIYTWFGNAQAGFSEKAAAGIIVLLFVLLSMNALAILLRAKLEKKY